MKLKQVERSSTLAWSPGQHTPLLALGTAAGALDASFSTKTELEIFDVNLEQTSSRQMKPMGKITENSRFNRLAWGLNSNKGDVEYGILAGGMENGELCLWNPKAILAGGNAVIQRLNIHKGAVRGLDFNPSQSHILASGATEGEIYVWDLNGDLKSPYHPGAKQKTDDITSVQWNRQVAHILASSNTAGDTVIWDLRSRKDLMHLINPNGRRPITSISWSTDTTRIVTGADDDYNPVILEWDLKNARTPVNVLSGHSKSVLSLSWCSKDSDLLLSCGKDNRVIVWNPTTGTAVGDLHQASNWCYDAQWYAPNPDLVAISSFDGKVTVHSLMGDASKSQPMSPTVPNDSVVEDDPFLKAISQGNQMQSQDVLFQLSTPPKWLKRPVSATWGFGGRLVYFNNENKIGIKTIDLFGPRIDSLYTTINQPCDDIQAVHQYCEELAKEESLSPRDQQVWKYLKSLFNEKSEEITEFLGFDPKNPAGKSLSLALQKLNIKSTSNLNTSPKKSNTALNEGDAKSPFHLYSKPKTLEGKEEADIDSLITRAVIVGDFATAVDVCLAADRLSDAIMLAASGGPELLQKTQKVYFEKTRDKKTYMRVLEGINEKNLKDIVENVVLDDSKDENWKDVLALLFVHGSSPSNGFPFMHSFGEDLKKLIAHLGHRLESGLLNPALKPIKQDFVPKEALENRLFAAVLCYLAAGELPSVVNVWTKNVVSGSVKDLKKKVSYTEHALSLQTLMEKISVFRKLINFNDSELDAQLETFALESLYEKYGEYAQVVADQGRINFASKCLEMIPVAFKSPEVLAILREQVYNSGRLTESVRYVPECPFKVESVGGDYNNGYADYSSNGYAANGTTATTYSNGYANNTYAANSYANTTSNSYSSTPAPTYPTTTNTYSTGNSYSTGTAAGYNTATYGSSPSSYGYGANNYGASSFGNLPAANNHGYNNSNYYQQPSHSFTAPPLRNPTPPSIPAAGNYSSGYSSPGATQAYPATFSPPPTSTDFNSGRRSVSRQGNPTPVPETNEPPKHAPGDRSHIPGNQKPVFHGLSKLAQKLSKTGVSPGNKRMFEDTEKKLNTLYDAMNNQQVPDDIANKLAEIIKAIEKNDFDTANKILLELMTHRFDVTGSWIVGVKRLISLTQKALNPPPAPVPVATPPTTTMGRPPPNAVNQMGRPPPSAGPPMGGPPPSLQGPPPMQRPPTGGPSMQGPPTGGPPMNQQALAGPPTNSQMMAGPPPMNQSHLNGPPSPMNPPSAIRPPPFNQPYSSPQPGYGAPNPNQQQYPNNQQYAQNPNPQQYSSPGPVFSRPPPSRPPPNQYYSQ